MPRRAGEAGFTLVELILVMVLIGIIGGSTAMLLAQGTRAYGDLVTRKETLHHARLALERVAREVRPPSAISLASGQLSITTTRPTGCTTTCDVVKVYYDSGSQTVRIQVNGAPSGGSILAEGISALSFTIDGSTPPGWLEMMITDTNGLKYRTRTYVRKVIFYPN